MTVHFSRKNLLAKVKAADEDYEWYPTTDEILTKVQNSIIAKFRKSYDDKPPSVSVLDCGAGDGKPLQVLSNGGDMYAIERSSPLLSAMPSDIFIVGTEFHESTLIDKKVDVVFCNPPYSEYEQWAMKIIREANARMVYLVVPSRWAGSKGIAEVIAAREAKVKVLGGFTFENADRKARAKVEVLRVELGSRNYRGWVRVDPFELWFDTTFAISADTDKRSEYLEEELAAKTLKSNVAGELVSGGSLVQTLVKLYNEEMAALQNIFKAVGELDYDILRELDVNVPGLRKALAQRITGLKHKYWVEFFDGYSSITDRLTSGSRKRMLDKLLANTSVDFTESNAYALTIWAIKNANKYYDSQLITLVDGMIERANVRMYASNKNTFGDEDWRYCRRGPKGFDKFGLEYRVILTRHRAIAPKGSWRHEFPNGLERSASQYLDDIMTVASNLGYQVAPGSSATLREWSSGKKHDFLAGGTVLMSVRAYINGNIHIKFNQDFIRRLNVEFGRLKGWLKSKEQASSELGIPLDKVAFNSNYQLGHDTVLMICN